MLAITNRIEISVFMIFRTLTISLAIASLTGCAHLSSPASHPPAPDGNREAPGGLPEPEVIRLDRVTGLSKIIPELTRARAVIVATGASPRMLGVPGEKEYLGLGVSYCATCDGPFFRDQRVVVVGGGDSALEEGLFLSEYVSSLTLVHRRKTFRAQKIIQDRFLARPNVSLKLESTVSRFEGGEAGLSGVVIRHLETGAEETIPAEGAFIYIGYDPAVAFLGGALETSEDGYLRTDERMRTSVEGVYAVGDVRKSPLKQVATAVGEGAIAAVTAEKYLRGGE